MLPVNDTLASCSGILLYFAQRLVRCFPFKLYIYILYVCVCVSYTLGYARAALFHYDVGEAIRIIGLMIKAQPHALSGTCLAIILPVVYPVYAWGYIQCSFVTIIKGIYTM